MHEPRERSFTYNVLIETLWNVKLPCSPYYSQVFLVLIETLWNVKDDADIIILEGGIVLIETLWNVKLLRQK